MAVKFWVPVSSAILWQQGVGDQSVSATNLNKPSTSGASIDDAVRLDWSQADRPWKLRGTTGTVSVSHGGITSVRLHARIYMSNGGPYSWDFSSYDAYVAPFFKKSGGTRRYNIPQTVNDGGTVLNVGFSFQNGHNWNQVGEPVPFILPASVGSGTPGWDITSFETWTNALLSGAEIGLSMDELQDTLGINQVGGWMPIEGPGGTLPRWNVSQLILEVDALDAPPPPVVTRPMFMVMG